MRRRAAAEGRRAITALRALPSVDKILRNEAATALVDRYGRPLTLDAIRLTLEEARASLKAEDGASAPEPAAILSRAEAHLSVWTTPTLRTVINGTGVILHTNLGRAPLSKATVASMGEIGAGYSNLELDLETGKRGERLSHVESILQALTGAEAALVVNNNASAILLALSALASRRRVIIARSQLIEIGGGFRMPEVMKQSGARLVEVGTTNKIHLTDYERELPSAALVLRAHRSNFKLVGFTEEPDFEEVVRLAHDAHVAVLDDLGSGALLDTARYGMAHEPTVQESLAAGADVVCFSGDKLLGGPQAGIIIGRAEHLTRIRKHPLARAVRADKTCLAGITATLTHYLKNEAEQEIPVWRMLSVPLDELGRRAKHWAASLQRGEVSPSQSTLGGGSLPGETLPTYVLSLPAKSPNQTMSRLRAQPTPIIARTERDRILIDPRTVLPEQDHTLLLGLTAALSERI